MVPINNLILFSIPALGLVLSPGPNMIYLISRSLTQGKRAGLISLIGIMAGFLVHILLVSFGLTAVFIAIPMVYEAIKWLGVFYLLYLAWQGVRPNSNSLFETSDLPSDSSSKLIRMGFLTNVLNPKVAIFYMSFFPQFTNPTYGNIIFQNIELGIAQLTISTSVNIMIILSASRLAAFFQRRPVYIKIQKRVMSGVLAGLAIRMAFDKGK